MKKILFFISSVYFCSAAIGQNKFPSPSDNAFWVEASSDWDPINATNPCSYTPGCDDHGGSTSKCPIYFGADILIDSTTYNSLYSHCVTTWQSFSNQPPPCPNNSYCTSGDYLYAIIKNDTLNNRVYIHVNNTDLLLYDFNLSVGQVYPNTYAIPNTDSSIFVVEVDSILFDSLYLKVWYLNTIDSFENPLIIIEGMGSNYGLRYSDWPQHMDGGGGLICFSRNGDIVYHDTNFSINDCNAALNTTDLENLRTPIIYPNPATSQLTIEFQSASSKARAVEIYNSLGQMVFQSDASPKLSMTINLEGYSKGLYLFKVRAGDEMAVKKIVIE